MTARARGNGMTPNGRLAGARLERACDLTIGRRRRLVDRMKRLELSARALHRILRVARTIADLAGEQSVADEHLAEAIQFRALDRPD